ncbi:NADH dehydrogenase FAD-containing subunit, partial [Alkalihalophilus pseudofirmus]|nr:NADH dehydrogenase FAD-containing subunit [Alkalihalophilus pseudofirmus]
KFMSVLEVAIGLALIVGLFTWLVSAGTVAMVAMFCLSGMFYWVNMWFVPVAIALMAGAGKTFGLDYYVMPWLGRLLDRWIWGQP